MPKSLKRRNVDKKVSVAESVRDSGGNVFKDMALPDADERLAKAEIAHQLGSLIKAAGLSQTEVGQRLGIDQPKVSAILRGRLKDFSTARLMRFVTMMDHDVVISIREAENRRHPRVRVLVGA